jgi:hypothetical protein
MSNEAKELMGYLACHAVVVLVFLAIYIIFRV